jgi:hypothetical protein
VPARGQSAGRTSSGRAVRGKRAPQQKKPTVVGSAAVGAPEQRTKAPETLTKQSASFLRSFLPALALFLWVRTCVVEPFFIPSLSMVPTLTPNDQIAVEKFSKIWVSLPRFFHFLESPKSVKEVYPVSPFIQSNPEEQYFM